MPESGVCLSVRDLHSWYDESHVLHGASFDVREGEIVTLLGRNGAGKTTTMRSIMGIVRKRQGEIRFRGTDLMQLPLRKIAWLGIGYVPEERGIFSTLSVKENLMLPPKVRGGGMSVDEIHELFPNLAGREHTLGTRLSGGEQQMLAIGRILRTGAELVLLDEPTEGLAPIIVEEIGRALKALKRRGLTIVLVEQNLAFATSIADRHYVMEEGVIVDEVPNEALEANMDRLNNYLGV